MNIEPSNAAEWVALIAVGITLIATSLSGFWAVFVRSQENHRAEWRRVEELLQIVQHGSVKGLWAQKLAVDELLSLKRPRPYVIPILKEASQHFSVGGHSGNDLATYIVDRMTEKRLLN